MPFFFALVLDPLATADVAEPIPELVLECFLERVTDPDSEAGTLVPAAEAVGTGEVSDVELVFEFVMRVLPLAVGTLPGCECEPEGSLPDAERTADEAPLERVSVGVSGWLIS